MSFAYNLNAINVESELQSNIIRPLFTRCSVLHTYYEGGGSSGIPLLGNEQEQLSGSPIFGKYIITTDFVLNYSVKMYCERFLLFPIFSLSPLM